MPHPDSLWKRFGKLLRGRSDDEPVISGNGDSLVTGTLDGSAVAIVDAPRKTPAVEATAPVDPPDATRDTHVEEAAPIEPHDMPRARTSLLRWGHREPNMAQLREGYQRVIELMDSISKHFEKQDGRAEQLAQSVDRVAGNMEQLAECQQSQGEFLRSIAEHAQQSDKHAAAMSETLGLMPSSLQAQADALRSVAQQLEVSQESDTQLVHSLQRFGQAVDSLRASGAAQVETLQSMHMSEREQKDALTSLVKEQGKRFLIVIVVAAVLGVGALAAVVTTLALVLGR